MPSSTWKHIGIAIATLGSLSISSALLWALYGNALIPVERLLPSDTAVLAANMDGVTLKALKTWFPGIAALPEVPRGGVSVLLPADDMLMPAVLTPDNSLSAHPYAVQAAPDIQRRIEDLSDSLEKDDAYAALLPKKRTDAAWLYVHPGHTGSGVGLSPWSWLTLSHPLSLSWNADTLELSVIDNAPNGLPTLSKQIPSVFVRPLFTVQGAAVADFWRTVSPAVAPDARFAIQSLLADAIRKRLGHDMSIPYDLAPLVNGESTLHLGFEGSDNAVRFLLEGALDASGPQKLRMLADSFESSLPSVKRETLTFKEGFTSDTLAENKDAIETQTLSLEGWDIRTVHHKESNRVLVSAVKDGRFLLSDSPAAVEAYVRKTLPSLSVSGINGTLLAAGMADRKGIDRLAQSALGEAWISPAFPETFGPQVLWSLAQERGRMVLRMENLNAE